MLTFFVFLYLITPPVMVYLGKAEEQVIATLRSLREIWGFFLCVCDLSRRWPFCALIAPSVGASGGHSRLPGQPLCSLQSQHSTWESEKTSILS